ncbi:rod shape-determining protein MreD [Marinospirillum alkaliphilum]|uniref:Rod shape-determining protein MreD n=1 Tax=Marinospirillum alkaliphilum DSM 21637 TaxID=1122209 RepID=A0A1K1YWI7_9GAMM|nr:rod shape-determining protein MreD [Marinospirillum alkaliphilum]SFX66232.1 rod shape-determining protein MreD [Marinospirillum alkaliphilum DSM 21637]
MAEKKFQGFWLIQLSFLVALYLQALPMPPALLYFRPEWLSLVLIFWSLSLPQRVGIMHGFGWGLLLDLIEGTLLGHNAVALALLGFLSNRFYQRIRMYSMLKQSALVFLLIGVSQLVFQWLQGIFGAMSGIGFLLLPALISAVLWHWVFVLLQGVKRRFALV